MSSNFSLSFTSVTRNFYQALDANDKDYVSGSLDRAQFGNFVLNNMQDKIADAIKKRDDAALDLPGLGKLPIGDDYDDAAAEVKALQQQQALLGKLLTTKEGSQSLFDKLAGADGKLSAAELKTLDANDDGKLTNSDFKTKFATLSDDAIAKLDDKLVSADRKAIVAIDPDKIDDDSKSGFDLKSLLPKLLTGQVGIGDLIPLLLGDEESDDPLMKILPALLSGGNGGNPIAALLPLLLGNDDDSTSTSDDSFKKLLPILLLTLSQPQRPAPAPAPAPSPFPSYLGGYGSGFGGGTNPFGI